MSVGYNSLLAFWVGGAGTTVAPAATAGFHPPLPIGMGTGGTPPVSEAGFRLPYPLGMGTTPQHIVGFRLPFNLGMGVQEIPFLRFDSGPIKRPFFMLGEEDKRKIIAQEERELSEMIELYMNWKKTRRPS